MPINRGPFNALVDDNGTGLTGSVWNKAAIQTVLLDPIDVAIPGVWATQPFNAGIYRADAGSWTVTSADFAYCFLGYATLAIQISVFGGTTAGSPNLLMITMPYPAVRAALGSGCMSQGYENSVALVGGSDTILYLRRPGALPWGNGSCTGQIFILLPLA